MSLQLPAAPPAPFSSLGATGSALKSSSMEAASELALEERAKGAVGRATPRRTGASSALAVSHSSSTAMVIRP